MEKVKLSQLLADGNDNETIEEQLNTLLVILRRHLNMEVAFISEFVNGMRIFRFINSDSSAAQIRPGDADPLEDTYCKRIADNLLPEIIPDTSQNVETQSLDVTRKLSIGSYIGVPMTLSNGYLYGTFCCFKRAADESLNQRDLAFLSAIAEISTGIIEKKLRRDQQADSFAKRIISVMDNNAMDIFFQPIFNLRNNEIVGFESLSRFNAEPYRTPDIWFREAATVGLGQQLELRAIEQATRKISQFNPEVYLSINASPEYILNGALLKALAHTDTRRIVLEVTEHTPITDYRAFREALAPLRERGVRLAIDDAGAGYSSFQHVLELEADMLKLDSSLTRGLNQEPRKALLAKSICAFARATDCKIVAEGIETEQELNTLKEIGVDMAQGFYLGHPMPLGEARRYECKLFR